MNTQTRPFSDLPRSLIVLLILGLALQIWVNQSSWFNQRKNEFQQLPLPLDSSVYALISAGSTDLTSYLLAIKVQLHDSQSGSFYNYDNLNYQHLVSWFQLIEELNPSTEYPAFLATRVYNNTQIKENLKQIVHYVEEAARLAPEKNWRRLTEAIQMAKYKLHDLELAIRLATQLAEISEEAGLPNWARDMRILLLADLNEFESAIIIVQSLLDSNSVSDNDERRFLQQKLLEYQQKLSNTRQ